MTNLQLAQIFEMIALTIRSFDNTQPNSSLQHTTSNIPTQIIEPVLHIQQPTIPTLSEWLVIHEEAILQKDYKIQTIRNRKANINHIRRLWGTIPITNLKAHEISSKIRTEFLPNKCSTAQRLLAELKDAYNEAIANDWVSTNPALHVKLPTHRVKRKRLSLDTYNLMLAHALSSNKKWLHKLLLLSLLTGQRRGDLVKMKFNDIIDNHLLIEQQKQAGKGYGARVSIPLSIKLDVINISLGEVIELCKLDGAI